jgi:hypothetical protein
MVGENMPREPFQPAKPAPLPGVVPQLKMKNTRSSVEKNLLHPAGMALYSL